LIFFLNFRLSKVHPLFWCIRVTNLLLETLYAIGSFNHKTNLVSIGNLFYQ
jgi:hypothetical protein